MGKVDTGGKFIPESLLARVDRPFLLWIAPPLLILEAVLLLAFCSVAIASSNVYVSVGQDPFSTLSNSAILTIAALNTALNGFAAFGLLRQRRWSRPILAFGQAIFSIVLLTLGVAAGAELRVAISNLLELFILVLFLFWYLYVRVPVRAYYNRLR